MVGDKMLDQHTINLLERLVINAENQTKELEEIKKQLKAINQYGVNICDETDALNVRIVKGD